MIDETRPNCNCGDNCNCECGDKKCDGCMDNMPITTTLLAQEMMSTMEEKDITFEVPVEEPKVIPVESISIGSKTYQMWIDHTFQLSCEVYPYDATNKKVYWTVSDPEIVRINETSDNKCDITGLKDGDVQISVMTEDGNFVDTCNLIVTYRPILNIRIEDGSFTMNKGEFKKLRITTIPDIGVNRDFQISSDYPDIISVDSEGNIEALKSGIATVTVKSVENPGIEASCAIGVVSRATGIHIIPEVATIEKGGTLQLEALITPEDATYKNVMWKSSGPEIAIVSQTGLVIPAKEGEIDITVTSVDGGYEASCHITVTPIKSILTIVSDPSDATVRINGVVNDQEEGYVGQWKSIEVKKEGYYSKYSNLILTEKNQIEEITLEPLQEYEAPVENAGVLQISSIDHLKWAGIHGLTQPAALTRNIDCGGEILRPIMLAAEFNGQDHKIYNFKIQDPIGLDDVPGSNTAAYGSGLFGRATANIMNLTVENVEITTTAKWVGGLVGILEASAANCHAKNVTIDTKHEFTYRVGGLVGFWRVAPGKPLEILNLLDCTVQDVDIKSSYAIGGLVGSIQRGSKSIEQCHVSGLTIDQSYVIPLIDRYEDELEKFFGYVGTLLGDIMIGDESLNIIECIVPEPNPDWYNIHGLETTDYTHYYGKVDSVGEIYIIDPIIDVTGVVINKTELELETGSGEQLFAAVVPDNASDQSITWESENPEIAVVTGSGKVVSRKAGQVLVTANNGIYSAGCIVTVSDPYVPVQKIALDEVCKEAVVGNSLIFTAQIFPLNATEKGVIWECDDPSILTIDEDGDVITYQAGETIITATSKDNPDIKASCRIRLINR